LHHANSIGKTKLKCKAEEEGEKEESFWEIHSSD